MAQDHTSRGTRTPSFPASHAAKLHWSLWRRQRKGDLCTNKMEKHVFLNCILLYSYFCLRLSLMLCLVWFWCSLLSPHASFPNTSNQFYNSAEGYQVYLFAGIEQQLIIGLFSASCILQWLARGFYISCIEPFGKDLAGFVLESTWESRAQLRREIKHINFSVPRPIVWLGICFIFQLFTSATILFSVLKVPFKFLPLRRKLLYNV